MAGFTRKEDSELSVQRKKEKALRVLAFDRLDRPNKDDIMQRYRSFVKAWHPDSLDALKEAVEHRPAHTLDELRQAKDFLVKYLEEL